MEKNNRSAVNFVGAFNFGLTTFRDTWPLLLSISFLYFLLSVPLNFLGSYFQVRYKFSAPYLGVLFFILELFVWVVSITLTYNITKMSLNIARKKREHLASLFVLPNIKTFKYFLTSLVYTILVLSGLVLFIFPGVYFAIKYFFATTVAVDKNVGILEAGLISAELVNGEKWSMFAYLLLVAGSALLMCIAGLVMFIVGIIPAFFIAHWVFTFANIHIYKNLSK